jgi:hypothetical protein
LQRQIPFVVGSKNRDSRCKLELTFFSKIDMRLTKVGTEYIERATAGMGGGGVAAWESGLPRSLYHVPGAPCVLLNAQGSWSGCLPVASAFYSPGHGVPGLHPVRYRHVTWYVRTPVPAWLFSAYHSPWSLVHGSETSNTATCA